METGKQVERSQPRGQLVGILLCAWILASVSVAAAQTAGALGREEPVAKSSSPVGGSDLFHLYPLLGLPPASMNSAETPITEKASPEGWLGIAPRETKPVFLPGADDFTPALTVYRVYPDSTASKAGLRPTDKIVAVNGEPLELGPENSLIVNFMRRVTEAGAQGALRLKLLRGGKVMDVSLKLDPPPMTSPRFKTYPELDRLHAEARETFFVQTLEREGMMGRFQETLRAMGHESNKVLTTAIQGGASNPFRLDAINYVMHRPMDLPWVADLLIRSVKQSFNDESQSLSRLVGEGLRAMDLSPDAKEKSAGEPPDLESFIDRLARAMNRAEALRREALSALSVEEIAFLEKGIRDWLFQDLEEDYLDRTEAEKQELENRFLRWYGTTLKVDRGKLLQAGKLIADVLDVEWLRRYKASGGTFHPHREGWVIREEPGKVLIQTAGLSIVVGNSDANVYSEDADVIIDLGGDDRYLNRAGASHTGGRNRVVIDLGGNDLYLSVGWGAQGAGLLGAGFLLDLGGDDRYVADHFAQGAGYLGVGVLVDTGGNDRYQCHVFCQGAGFLGIGVLADRTGDDHYANSLYGQGLGATGGYGLLVDAGGQDRYSSGGTYADYSEPLLAFRSLAQGVGLGYDRWDTLIQVSGGIGILVDQKGHDTYIADYFAQGAGRAYGLGILFDDEGDDRYLAGRYAQGAGFRHGAGLLLDNHGDDDYLSHAGVSQGVGHEFAIGVLIDRGGDDRYTGSLLSQGAGHGHGIGMLVDTAGNDEYICRDLGQGFGLYDDIQKRGGFGFLFDAGGGADRYSMERKNDSIQNHQDWGISADLP